jgi:hypothetical protein
VTKGSALRRLVVSRLSGLGAEADERGTGWVGPRGGAGFTSSAGKNSKGMELEHWLPLVPSARV